jgi:hypothetical protein
LIAKLVSGHRASAWRLALGQGREKSLADRGASKFASQYEIRGAASSFPGKIKSPFFSIS